MNILDSKLLKWLLMNSLQGTLETGP